jgi:hypothetical protein
LLELKKLANYSVFKCGHSSVVERLVANEKVEGSTPFARSIIKQMIIWIASYPKSGNTFLRTFLASYYYSKKGKFDFDLLLKIHQFPNMKFSKTKSLCEEDASSKWILNQNEFFDKDNLNFVKTHNCLLPYKGNKFTTKDQTIGAIYVVRDPRNVITSMTHHYSITYEIALKKMLDDNATLLQKSYDGDFSNFTYLSSWSKNYRSWKNSNEFKMLFIKYEDLELNKEDTFAKVLAFINALSNYEKDIDEKKFYNSLKSTSFSNLQNKEKNEGFEESVISRETGKKIPFFNLGFKNRWQKILPEDIKKKINQSLSEDIKALGY